MLVAGHEVINAVAPRQLEAAGRAHAVINMDLTLTKYGPHRIELGLQLPGESETETKSRTLHITPPPTGS